MKEKITSSQRPQWTYDLFYMFLSDSAWYSNYSNFHNDYHMLPNTEMFSENLHFYAERHLEKEKLLKK